jgi:predicted DNA-binding protein
MPDSDVQISARIPRAHFEKLERLARENDRTVSAEIRRAIRVYLAQAFYLAPRRD